MIRKTISVAISGLLLSASLVVGPSAQARTWWQTALADGAGCLGLSEFGLPGCILGAAAGSLAIASPPRGSNGSLTVWDPKGNGGCTDTNLPKPFQCGSANTRPPALTEQNVGAWHNWLVKTYASENRSYNRDAFVKMALREMAAVQGLAAMRMNADMVTKSAQAGEMLALAGDVDCDGRGYQGPRPCPFVEEMIANVGAAITNARTDAEKITAVNALEKKFSAGRPDGMEPVWIKRYFSILRSSMAYWHNSASLAFGNCMTEPSRCGTVPIED